MKSKSTFGRDIWKERSDPIAKGLCMEHLLTHFYVVPRKQMLRGLGLGKLITKGVHNGSIQKFNLVLLK